MNGRRTLALALIPILFAGAALAEPPAAGTAPPAPAASDCVTGDPGGLPRAEELLDRIERYKTISPDSAQWRRQQAQSEGGPQAALDVLLLDLFAPEAAIPTEQAQARLDDLMKQADPGWRQDSLQLLQLISDQLRLRSEADHLQSLLAQERQAHQETREKLDAIRRIEQEMEDRSSELEHEGAR